MLKGLVDFFVELSAELAEEREVHHIQKASELEEQGDNERAAKHQKLAEAYEKTVNSLRKSKL